MKVVNYKFPKSSFLSVEKDLELITSAMLKNQRFKKLLYYTTNDALDQKDLSTAESLSLLNKNIKIVPKLYIDGSVLAYVIISFDNFISNGNNPEFRDNVVSFDIICHFDQWQLEDFQLRPYRIAAEIDTMFNGQHLTGIGTLNFLSANQLILNDEFAGITIMYEAIHGEEDKKGMLNPDDNAEYILDFDETFNEK